MSTVDLGENWADPVSATGIDDGGASVNAACGKSESGIATTKCVVLDFVVTGVGGGVNGVYLGGSGVLGNRVGIDGSEVDLGLGLGTITANVNVEAGVLLATARVSGDVVGTTVVADTSVVGNTASGKDEGRAGSSAAADRVVFDLVITGIGGSVDGVGNSRGVGLLGAVGVDEREV